MSQVAALLDSVSTQYASARSYADDGEVVDISADPKKPPFRWRFKTRFVRSVGFAFRCEDAQEPVLPTGIWLQDGKVWRTDFEGNVETRKDLVAGLSGLAGLSGTASFAVTPLLLPNESLANFYWNPVGAVIVGQEMIDGVSCTRVEMPDSPRAKPIQIWIGNDDKLIHRIRVSTIIEAGETTIDLHPRMNIDIDPKELILDRIVTPAIAR